MFESSLGIVGKWFNSEYAMKIGKDEWDVKVRGEMRLFTILSERQI